MYDCSLCGCLLAAVCCLVLIIDDAQKDSDKKIVMEFTFIQPVMSVRLRMDRYYYDTCKSIEHLYSTFHGMQTTLKPSGMDHTI